MRQSLVVGNWKMHGSTASIESLLNGIKQGIAQVQRAQVGVCPSFVYIQMVAELLKGSVIRWGAQNVSNEDSGAFTGEVAASMLADFSCTYVIIGHSERRHIYGESSALVAQKYAKVQAAGLTPILCVGELLNEREAGQTEQVVAEQLNAVLTTQGIESFKNAVIAYEPVWAIGTGKTATPEQAQEVHAFIRQLLAQQDANIAAQVQILYGGSVKASNAAEIFQKPDVDGGLIGGAALKADEFLAICQAA